MVWLQASLILVIGSLISLSESLRFEMKSGEAKCIAEEINTNFMTVGKFSVVNPNEGQPMPASHKISVKAITPRGDYVHSAELVESGQFSFTTTVKGEHHTCFMVADHNPPAVLTIEFDWKYGVATRDWPNVAKKGQVDVMELELKKLQDSLTSIHEEMFYLRDREEEMQELNRSTNTNMAWMSGLSIVICLSVAGLQLWHLKTFFEKKKLV